MIDRKTQAFYLISQLKIDPSDPFLPIKSEEILLQLITRMGLRKSLHFLCQSLFEFNSLKENLKNLSILAVYIRILYNEQLLTPLESSKFRYYLQDYEVSNSSYEQRPFFLTLIPLKSPDHASLQRNKLSFSETSIENTCLNDKNKGKNIEESRKSILKGLEKSYSPLKLLPMSVFSRNNSLKQKETPEIDESYNEKIILIKDLDKKSSNNCKFLHQKSLVLKPDIRRSVIRLISPKSINSNTLNLTWAKSKTDLYYSNYTLEDSLDKSPKGDIIQEKEFYRRSFMKKDRMIILRQNSL